MKWFRRRQQPEQTLTQTDRGTDGPCTCDPKWPNLETEANGHPMPAVASDHPSPVTAGLLGPLEARCTTCHATYPGNWVLAPGTPPPFAWARGGDDA